MTKPSTSTRLRRLGPTITVMISASTSPGNAMNRSISATSSDVQPATEIAGDQSNRHTDCHRHDGRAEPDDERRARAIDHPARDIAPKVVCAEQMHRRRQASACRYRTGTDVCAITGANRAIVTTVAITSEPNQRPGCVMCDTTRHSRENRNRSGARLDPRFREEDDGDGVILRTVSADWRSCRRYQPAGSSAPRRRR